MKKGEDNKKHVVESREKLWLSLIVRLETINHFSLEPIRRLILYWDSDIGKP